MSPDAPFTAASLRRYMAEVEAEKRRALLSTQAEAEAAARDFARHFMHDRPSEEERRQLRVKILSAVENGHHQVLAMRFPSNLCSDSGRAINNSEPGWAETLLGKARKLYEIWLEEGKPNGFHLKAMIVNYPDGMPGDVGLFLSWEE